MLLPSNIIPLDKWRAFKAKLPPGSDDKHRIIIIYNDGTVIKYFYVTSQIEKLRKRAKYDIASLVELSVDDWDALTKESGILCDKEHVKEIRDDVFRTAYANDEIEYLGKVPEKVKNAIIYAICMSVSYTETDKILYTT